MNGEVYPLNIFYESACPLCNAEMTNLKLRNTAGLLQFTDVSAPGFASPIKGVAQNDLLELIHAQRADGTVIKGVEVFRLAYSAVGINWPAAITRWPLVRGFAESAYRKLARIRHLIPAKVVELVFATALRRAAEKAVAQRCSKESGCGSASLS